MRNRSQLRAWLLHHSSKDIGLHSEATWQWATSEYLAYQYEGGDARIVGNYNWRNIQKVWHATIQRAYLLWIQGFLWVHRAHQFDWKGVLDWDPQYLSLNWERHHTLRLQIVHQGSDHWSQETQSGKWRAGLAVAWESGLWQGLILCSLSLFCSHPTFFKRSSRDSERRRADRSRHKN